MDKIEFTPKECEVIADFGFAYQTDTLIKNEAVQVIKVMAEHKLITDCQAMLRRVEQQDIDIATDIITTLREKISKEQRKEIVYEYQGEYVSPLAVTEGL